MLLCAGKFVHNAPLLAIGIALIAVAIAFTKGKYGIEEL
jgi:hypothetical protein